MILILVTTVYFRVLLIILSLSGALLHKNIYVIQKLQNRAARLLAQNFHGNIRGIDIVRGLGWQNVEIFVFYHIVSLINLK